jgi:hypothetical protein
MTPPSSRADAAQYFGKFRAIVTDIHDPQQLGRIQIMIPDLGAMLSSWALPCVSASLPEVTGAALPSIGSRVWIEFEHGDIDFPIWTGCFYADRSTVPPALRTSAS